VSFRRIDDAPDGAGKRALVRVDFNVPLTGEGKVADDTRLRAALPTIEALQAKDYRVVLMAHFDRPKGKRAPEMSLSRVVDPLSALLDAPVAFAEDCIGDVARKAAEYLPPRGVLVCLDLWHHREDGPVGIDQIRCARRANEGPTVH
jgi:phosphoglycerate kinase